MPEHAEQTFQWTHFADDAAGVAADALTTSGGEAVAGALGIGSAAAEAAADGAAIGSVVPGAGTVLGAAGGAVVGVIAAYAASKGVDSVLH
jgi:hypothetical protein